MSYACSISTNNTEKVSTFWEETKQKKNKKRHTEHEQRIYTRNDEKLHTLCNRTPSIHSILPTSPCECNNDNSTADCRMWIHNKWEIYRFTLRISKVHLFIQYSCILGCVLCIIFRKSHYSIVYSQWSRSIQILFGVVFFEEGESKSRKKNYTSYTHTYIKWCMQALNKFHIGDDDGHEFFMHMHILLHRIHRYYIQH